MFSSVSAIGETRDWSRIRFGGGAQATASATASETASATASAEAILGEISSSYKSKGDSFGSRPSGTQTKQEDGENGIVLAATRDH